ncbi:AAA family ATPase [Microlunatus sp. Y2014]|uniref:AAA family ATPase n=1 Tax=Microlunatus sp. Y2014 TaxID=3418488 RepID=UPI003DA6E121
MTDTATESGLLARMFSARWLMTQDFPPVEYVVPGLIPEGMTVIASAPKIGKSWLVLGLGLAAASGGVALGHLPVTQRPVLYLALEDGQRRLQYRLGSLGVHTPPDHLEFLTSFEQHRLLDTMTEFLELYAGEAPCIILDTLGKARPPTPSNEPQYAQDYRFAGLLKSAVDAHPGSSLICVHHTRKAETGDFLDAVSGTQGIAGAADTIAVLRRDRQDSNALLHVTSRDAQEGTYSLTLSDKGAWTLHGESLADAAKAAQLGKATTGLGDTMATVVAYVNDHPEGVRWQDIATACELTDDNAQRYLSRAYTSGRIQRTGRGLYTPVSEVSDCPNEPDTDTPLPIRTTGHSGQPLQGGHVTEDHPNRTTGQPDSPHRSTMTEQNTTTQMMTRSASLLPLALTPCGGDTHGTEAPAQ